MTDEEKKILTFVDVLDKAIEALQQILKSTQELGKKMDKLIERLG